MLSISKRGAETQSSPIRKLVPFAEQAKKQGKNVFHLNLGQPDIMSPPNAFEHLKNTYLPIIEYSHSAGILSLRTALATYYNNMNISITHDNILITIGGSEALLNIFSSTMDPNDEVIIPEPYYTNYNFFAHILGIKIVPLYCDIKNNFKLPSISEFEKLITPKTKAILINNPGNPTGVLYTNQELEILKHIVKKNNLYLIADEVYREFCYDNHIHKSVLHLNEITEHTIVIDSFSKRYSLCGIRVGAIITRNQELLNISLKFSQGRISPPTLGQILAEAALKTTNHQYLIDMKNEYQKRRDIIINALTTISGVMVPEPQGAFYCMVQLPIDDSEKFCQWLLEKFSYQNNTLMLAPGGGFYSNPELGKKQVRIAYVLNAEKLKEAMECLKIALQEYNS